MHTNMEYKTVENWVENELKLERLSKVLVVKVTQLAPLLRVSRVVFCSLVSPTSPVIIKQVLSTMKDLLSLILD